MISALKILMIFDDFKVSSTIEKRFPSSSCAFLDFLFRLFPTQEMIPPITGKTNRENKVRLGESANSVIREAVIIKGALITSTKLPIIEFSILPMSFEILLIMSPFLCSVKKETGNFRNF